MHFNTGRHSVDWSKENLFWTCFPECLYFSSCLFRLDLSWCLWTESPCTELRTSMLSTSSEKPSATRPKTPWCLWSKSSKTFERRLETHEIRKNDLWSSEPGTNRDRNTWNTSPNTLMCSEVRYVTLPFMLELGMMTWTLAIVEQKTGLRQQNKGLEWMSKHTVDAAKDFYSKLT